MDKRKRKWREGEGGDYSREAIIFSSKGGDYSREAVNRGTAIIRGNPVSFLSSSLAPNSDSFFQVIFKWYLPIFLSLNALILLNVKLYVNVIKKNMSSNLIKCH